MSFKEFLEKERKKQEEKKRIKLLYQTN